MRSEVVGQYHAAAMPRLIRKTFSVPPLGCNCSIIGDPVTKRAIVVDPGGAHERILNEVQQLGLTVTHILHTHAHFDHFLAAGSMKQVTGATLCLHQDDLDLWKNLDMQCRLFGVAALPVPTPDYWLKDEEKVSIGQLTVIALHTPGHSPDHIAFWHDASGTVFSGDLVIAGASVMIHTSGGGDLEQYLASLTRIRELKPRRLLPAHGAEVTDPDTLLTQYIAHRQQREQQVLAALASGHRTVESIAESIYHGLEPRLVPAARENVLAHLQKLRREGRAFEEESSHTWTT